MAKMDRKNMVGDARTLLLQLNSPKNLLWDFIHERKSILLVYSGN